LLTASSDKTLKILDLEKSVVIYTQKGAGEINCLSKQLTFGGGAILSGDDEGNVKLWDLQRGTFVMNGRSMMTLYQKS
jgi:WD40 repeat protein